MQLFNYHTGELLGLATDEEIIASILSDSDTGVFYSPLWCTTVYVQV